MGYCREFTGFWWGNLRERSIWKLFASRRCVTQRELSVKKCGIYHLYYSDFATSKYSSVRYIWDCIFPWHLAIKQAPTSHPAPTLLFVPFPTSSPPTLNFPELLFIVCLVEDHKTYLFQLFTHIYSLVTIYSAVVISPTYFSLQRSPSGRTLIWRNAFGIQKKIPYMCFPCRPKHREKITTM
jgi:hypothetical protein